MGSIAIAGSGSSSSSGLVIGTTTITGGSDTHVLYDNAGTVGEMSMFTNLSGSPNAATSYYCQSKPAVFVVPNASGDNWFEGEAGNFTVTGFQNFGTGTGALSSLTSGSNNTAIGVNALKNATVSVGNLAIGEGALGATVDGSQNVAIGINTLANMLTDQSNVAIGQNALISLTSTGNSNLGNVAIGGSALHNATTNGLNVAIGIQSLVAEASGTGNTAIGAYTFQSVNGGSSNTGIGGSIAQFMTTGSFNIFIGQVCAQNISGGSSNNVWIGPSFAGPAAVFNNTFALSLGGNTLLADRNITAASKWTFADYATAGLMTTNSNGTISIANTTTVASVPLNFSAPNYITLNIGGVTYYIPADTAPW